MQRLILLEEVARDLGYSIGYVRHIAADQGRPPSERRYAAHIHERFPEFRKHGRRWVTIEAVYNELIARRQRRWFPKV